MLDQVDAERLAAALAADWRVPEAVARERLGVFLNEASYGLEVIRPYLRARDRILEVGAGPGLLALALRAEGFDVTALDPGGVGFRFLADVRRRAAPLFDGAEAELPWLSMDVTALDPTTCGPFDLIFSISVLEHLPRLEAAFRAMEAVLAPGGLMVHLCPNYAVPYEPHFGVPLVPGAPRLAGRLFRRRISAGADLWASIHFVTCRSVRMAAQAAGLAAEVEPQLLAAAERLRRDPAFARRHAAWPFRALSAALDIPGVKALLGRIPPSLSTPMLVRLRRQGQAGA